MTYTPLPNPWKNIPYVGALIDAIQTGLQNASMLIRKEGTDIGTEPAINFLEGANIAIIANDDTVNEEVEVTISVDDTNAIDISNIILKNTYSNIPSAGTAGRLFFATDTATFYRDNGSSWDTLAQDLNGASRIAVDLRAPDPAGNCFPTVTALTAWNNYHWEMTKDVTGYVDGIVKIPNNVTVGAQKVVLELMANATTGVTRIYVQLKNVADGSSMNPASLSVISTQDITVPGTARLRKKVTFTDATNTWAAGDILIVRIVHDGTHTNDTLAVNTELLGAWIELT